MSVDVSFQAPEGSEKNPETGEPFEWSHLLGNGDDVHVWIARCMASYPAGTRAFVDGEPYTGAPPRSRERRHCERLPFCGPPFGCAGPRAMRCACKCAPCRFASSLQTTTQPREPLTMNERDCLKTVVRHVERARTILDVAAENQSAMLVLEGAIALARLELDRVGDFLELNLAPEPEKKAPVPRAPKAPKAIASKPVATTPAAPAPKSTPKPPATSETQATAATSKRSHKKKAAPPAVLWKNDLDYARPCAFCGEAVAGLGTCMRHPPKPEHAAAAHDRAGIEPPSSPAPNTSRAGSLELGLEEGTA